MLSFWKVMLKSPTFWPFFSTNLSQKHKINFLSSMKLVTVPQKLFPNPKSNFTIRDFFLQWLELVWQRYNCFSIFPIFHFSSRLPTCIKRWRTQNKRKHETKHYAQAHLSLKMVSSWLSGTRTTNSVHKKSSPRLITKVAAPFAIFTSRSWSFQPGTPAGSFTFKTILTGVKIFPFHKSRFFAANFSSEKWNHKSPSRFSVQAPNSW